MTTSIQEDHASRPHDLELAQAAANGDRAAQAAVIARVDLALRGLAYRLSSVDAEDLLQEARAWLLRPDVLRAYQGLGSFDGFLRVVGGRVMFAAQRQSSTRHWRTQVHLVAEHTEATTNDQADTVDDRLDDRLRTVLACLPRRAQQVVFAVAVLELSYKEAGLALDMPVGTVGSTYCRALRILRAQLAGQHVRLPESGSATQRKR